MAFRKQQFRSKSDGFKVAKKCHVCLDCRHVQTDIYKICPACGSRNRQYFMSAQEFRRGMNLLVMQSSGLISGLKFQPRYDLVVNGQKVGVYVADAEYFEGGQKIIEDTKPPDFIDKYAALKIKIFEAIYNVQVKIPARKQKPEW